MKKRVLALFAAAAVVLGAAALIVPRGLQREPDDWELTDFEGCFEEAYPTEKEEYPLLEGTDEENAVCVLKGAEKGPTVYIVAGVHGDEQAGWRAGNLLKDATLKAGTLYIVSPANLYGAQADQRRTKEDRDLNRNFPGDPNGCDAERIAWSIYSDAADKDPVLVLDLHEAIAKEDDYEALGANYDALGNSIICQDITEIGDLVMEVILASEAGELCSGKLTLYGSPPVRSVNRVMTLELGIPTVTVETLRAEPLAQRVQNQLELVQFVLEYYGMR